MMKYFTLLFFIMTTAIEAKSQCVLVKNGRSTFRIVLADKKYIEAGTVLRDIINRSTNVKLPMSVENPKCSNCIVIGTAQDLPSENSSTLNSNPTNSYSIVTTRNSILLISGNGGNVVIPVIEFLKKYFNARVYDGGGVITQNISTINIPVEKVTYVAPFEYRDLYYKVAFDSTFMQWNQINHIWSSKDSKWGNWVHTAYEFIDVPHYYKSNPEYFALVNGKRVTTQLCYSNKDVYAIVLRNLKAKIQQHPEREIWSFSQNDNNNYCQCDLCTSADRRLGTHGGPLMLFVNQLATDIPNKTISTLAYGFTMKAPDPKQLKLRSNILIVYCVTQGNKAANFATDISFKDMRTMLDGWFAQTNNIYIWDYIVNFQALLMPFPNFSGIQSALQYYQKLGVKAVFLQGNNKPGAEFSGLRAYISSQLLWDPSQNLNKLMQEYCNYAYGPASGDVSQLISAMLANSAKTYLIVSASSADLSKSLFSTDQMSAYYAIIDKGLSKVSKGTLYYNNLMAIRYSLDFTSYDMQRRMNGKSNGLMRAATNKPAIDFNRYDMFKNVPVDENNTLIDSYLKANK
ncbi:DUF4838 domain-containing protein [Chitinophaga terrae (ex Kim and Jung 2007)]|nr:DUF4838 domain-containing protein [Chitinophaga terrae (ex Kim and Jung 2007)]